MSNLEMYKNAFLEVFEIEENQLAGLKYQDIPLWDSVGHMTLIAKLEELYDIMFDAEDIIEFSSYEVGMEILSNKYGVAL